ncbi:MAG: BREX-1 system phosphatase PglZ type A [Gammaproteobacteria bacterium]|nr:MAG: BREX-1 system phosphatase PglZ type A [Gammaproteobacteria bacterium]
MNESQLKEGLLKAFESEGHRLVFWYDPEADFQEEVTGLALPDVQVMNMQSESALATKLKLELEDTTGKYLLYFPYAEPDEDKDWLLDIKLYSRCFYADRISIIFNDLGLQQQGLREHLATRQQFLGSKARIGALKKWLQADANEIDIDLAMITAVVKAENSDIPHILFSLAEQSVDNDLGLEANPASFDELAKYGLMPALVKGLKAKVGYPASVEELAGDAPLNFGIFLIRLLTTGFCESISNVPGWAQELSIPSETARASARALLSRWRDSSRYYKSFDVISSWVSQALRIDERLDGLTIDTLAQVATFEAVERKVIVDIASAIPQAGARNLAEFSSVIAHRLDGYWASRHKDDDTRRKYRTIYTALSSAITLYELRTQHTEGFHYPSTEAIYKAYETDLYQFDMAYRHYYEASLRAHVDLLKKLDDEVEQCYANWYIDNLAKNWGDKVEAENRLAAWHVPDVPNQQSFFQQNVDPVLGHATPRRIVVIISDAFRYEAAVELKDRINEKRYSEATLSSQLGVVPSYTTLGMASLLPHSSLEYREGVSDDVFVDGQSSKGTANRNKILAARGGMAVRADEVKQWSRDEGREALKDQYLVYVYHNVVDATGDSASTESDTFRAVEHAIDELTELSRKVMMHFNTSTVVVTADHGFLFQQSKLEAADRTSMAEKPSNALKSKKRYVIGHGLQSTNDAWSGSTKFTAGTVSDTDFYVPKGANRFHFVGGARFVHGGVMPQEIVVPVLTIRQLRGDKAEKRTKRKVGVISTKSSLKMVNNIQRFDLMQTETVSDKVLPVTISVAIYDADQKVSSEEAVTFDSTSDSMSDRVKQVPLSLSGSNYDRKKDYFLIIKDKDLGTEVERYRVTIDLAFTDDFN